MMMSKYKNCPHLKDLHQGVSSVYPRVVELQMLLISSLGFLKKKCPVFPNEYVLLLFKKKKKAIKGTVSNSNRKTFPT